MHILKFSGWERLRQAGVQAAKDSLSCTFFAMTARQLGVVALERLPNDTAGILARAAVWPDCAEDYDLDGIFSIAGDNKEIHLLPPVSKNKQQRLQNTAVAMAFSVPHERLEVVDVCDAVTCKEAP